jgi:hypothetical protein
MRKARGIQVAGKKRRSQAAVKGEYRGEKGTGKRQTRGGTVSREEAGKRRAKGTQRTGKQ